MIDHVTIRVSDVEAGKKFYEQAFSPLGYTVAFGETGEYHSFDIGQGLFEIMQSTDPPSPPASEGRSARPPTPTHVALRVKDKRQVEAFYKAALAVGGKDNGPPGPRLEYTKTYYACFVLDPDDHNIEAMID